MASLSLHEDFETEDARELRREVKHPRPALVKKVEAALNQSRIEGNVRKLKQDRGFGFIAGDDGRDHFFHWSGMDKSSKNFRELEIQDRVSFVVIEGEKGPRAVLIKVLEE